MAAAYAALMSLMHTSELILHPSQKWLRLHRKQIESLLQKVRFLQEFLEDYSHRRHEEMAGLERQIADVAYAAEDIIESHVLDQILARSTGSEAKSSTSFSEYIQKLIEEMEDLIKNKVMRIKETIGDSEEDQMFVDFSPAVLSRLAPSDQNTLVGSDEKLIEIMDRLTGHQSNRQIIAIVGIGGIEGFLKPIIAKSLEEVAYEYMTDLIDRNLISVNRQGTLRRSKTCHVHDLLRDLCLREAQKENIFVVINEQNPGIPLEIEFNRRLFFYQSPKEFTKLGHQILDLLKPASLKRSLTGQFGCTLSLASSLRLLRVLDVDQDKEFPPTGKEIMQLLNLRFMRIAGTWYSNSMWRFTSSISQFWSLQFLCFHDYSNNTFFLPSEIWDLPQLRHLIFKRVVLPDPSCSHNDEHDSHILEHLQTLYTVINFRCTKEVLKSVPNVMKLKITYDHLSLGVDWSYFCLHNLVHLRKLESLKFGALDPIFKKYLSFPLSLKKLKLSGCRLPWEDMTIVGSLPNLEALELRSHAFEGLEWCPVEGEFLRLKLLVIEETDLSHWRAEKTHFPILEHLVLQGLDLAEIPGDLGELSTLRKIELFNCGDFTNTWAEQIREEQESFGNEDLQIIIKQKREED